MIEVKNLTKTYGVQRGIENINFFMGKGEVVGLLGLNGAGKSTTMNILSGCMGASSGHVTIDGIDLFAEPAKAKVKIGYLPEIPPLYLDMRVCEYLNFVFELKGVKKHSFDSICTQVGIDGIKKRLIKNLSKGYRQRVGLAAALVGDPEILILDEPTVGLDPTQIIEIRNLILSLGKNRTVILSSHILSEIEAVCSRVFVIHQGKLITDDTPENLVQKLNPKNVCLAQIEGKLEDVQKALLDAGISVQSLRPANISFEEAFLNVVGKGERL